MADVADFTRTTIKSLVEGYYNRSLGANESAIFQLAMKRINRDLIHPLMETTVTVLGTSVPYTLPDDFKQIKSVYLADSSQSNKELRFVNYENLKRIQETNSGDVPDVYSLNANTLHTGPDLTDTQSIEITYYQKIDEVIAITDSNTATQHFTMLVVYAMLIDAYGLVRDLEAVASWKAFYEDELAKFNTQGWNQSVGSAMYMRNI